MTWHKILTYSGLVLFLFFTCSVVDYSVTKSEMEYEFPYDFKDALSMSLPKSLKEISGLTFDDKTNRIYCVEDENGVVYTLDRNTGKIVVKNKFFSKGDYEGICLTKNSLFILNSRGILYKLPRDNFSAEPVVINCFNNVKIDLEGLAYDKKSNSLLIACKGFITDDLNATRTIYRYDIKKEKVVNEPYLRVSKNEFKSFMTENYSLKEASKMFKKTFDEDKEQMHFGPSAIAIHPKTRNTYVLSSQGSCVIIYKGKTNKILHVEKLSKKLFEQPEGICFEPNGNMYISSEGKKHSGKLVFIPAKI